MSENVQYETTSPPQSVPTRAPNLRSTLDVPTERAIQTITAITLKSVRQAQTSGIVAPPPIEAS